MTAIAKALRLNERINTSPVRVIDQNQRQLGVISTAEALNLAKEAGMDLVEVSPMERPPVCRVMDYGKFQYERKKRQKTAAGGHTIVLKEIRLRPKTDTHDRSVKMKRAKEFLDDGHKVQFTMLFRGRERAHRELAFAAFNAIIQELGEAAKVERHSMMEGRRMTMVVVPGKPAKKPVAAENAKNEPPPPPPPTPAPSPPSPSPPSPPP